MKKIYTLHNLLIGAALLLLSSCQTADDTLAFITPSEETDGLAGSLVQLDASSFALPEAGTRAEAATFPVKGSTMTVGMTVGNSTTYANYTYDGTVWKADATNGNKALRWEDNEVEHSFIAVSPSRDMGNPDFTLPDAYTSENFADYDNLFTTTEAYVTKPVQSISLSMKHALVKITILSLAETVKLTGQELATTFNLATGALNTVGHANASGEITMYKNGPVYIGYILPRATGEQLTYYSTDDLTFPEDTEMPAGSNFICSEGITLITSTAGGLKAELDNASSAKTLYINGVVDASDMTELKTFLLKEGCAVEELYVDAAGTEKLEVSFNSGVQNKSVPLKKVVFFKTVTAGKELFKNCKKMVSVSMPVLTESGAGLLNGCEALTDINLPQLTTLNLGWHFAECTSLKTIYLPKLQSVGAKNIFSKSKSLEKIILPALSEWPMNPSGTSVVADFTNLSTVVLKGTGNFDNSKLPEHVQGNPYPTLFVTDAVSEADMGTALSGKYDADKAYSTYNTSVPMTVESLINLENYSVTWTKP